MLLANMTKRATRAHARDKSRPTAETGGARSAARRPLELVGVVVVALIVAEIVVALE